MSEPMRYSTPPLDLPVWWGPEPGPVEGCPACAWLVDVRAAARQRGDMAKVSDCNVLLRRHPQGHR
ncbi:hypothetical protein BJP40_07540 [Streptomyces sp. CC53]|uniref:hypothetical protein n=1 Tax=unclassified Streptomyces TaxID=2593676 RepID=UPI0008DE60DD|nr:MULTISPECIES: hypothetical protein [unclassified Streptomyces]OII61008.1 hypothetical protein BJP40_07540 [Streptomyces sp. CC53]